METVFRKDTDSFCDRWTDLGCPHSFQYAPLLAQIIKTNTSKYFILYFHIEKMSTDNMGFRVAKHYNHC
jgi:hypothetical protein